MIAHIRYDGSGKKVVQTVSEHCRGCARYASERSAAGFSHAAHLVGLLHDLGKNTGAFRDYIERAAAGEPVRKGSVNHTFAGVRFAMEQWHAKDRSPRSMACELIAYAVGAHHGLFDCIGPGGEDGYAHRARKDGIGYQEAREHFLSDCAGLDELNALFVQAQAEITTAMARFLRHHKGNQESRFGLFLLSRMLLSCAIDADRRDTAEFMHDTVVPRRNIDRTGWERCLEVVERGLDEMAKAPEPNEKQEINRARREISAQCREAAKRGSGVYKLSVPTGGGKTLASLRYALATAAEHEKRRILFVIPLLSVLEQNAGVIRDAVKDDALIVEHHSNVLRENAPEGELSENELLMEAWDAPILITTLVQLLNTLFSGKTSCVRRMSALQGSVIVIDEVQTVPQKMLSLFNMAMDFLADVCDATVLLCSATQPCLDRAARPIADLRDLIECDYGKWPVFRRTRIIDRRKAYGYTIDELAEFTVECLEREGGALLICNTKAQALAAYRAVSARTDAEVYHLSTSMCMEHRIATLEKIKQALKLKRRVVCVATQLVEAGVDFSFACAIRVLAGLDNVVQAAGRCNRSGELGRLCPVYIVNIHQESLGSLKEIEQAQRATEHVLESIAQDTSAPEQDLSSERWVSAYYTRLYANQAQSAQDYPLPEHASSLFTLLADNRAFWHHCETKDDYALVQAFHTAGDAFRVFDDNTTDVLVPYGEGVKLIADLCSEKARFDFKFRKQALDRAKRFTISLYEYEVQKLRENRGLYEIWDGDILALQPGYYSGETGLFREGGQTDFAGV